MMLLAEIVNNEKGTADWLFLFAAILFGLAALVSIPSPGVAKASAWRGFLVAAGLTLVAVAWLLL
jgi:hypothetical protein